MNRSNSNKMILAVLILFGVTTAFLGYKYSQERHSAKVAKTEQMKVSDQYAALNDEFNQLNKELSTVKAENIQLSEELQARVDELEVQKVRINQLINAGGSKELKEARAMISQLKAENAELLAQVRSLTAENLLLKEENTDLASNLKDEVIKNAMLTSDNQTLSKNLADVTADRDRLVPIANYGQVIRVEDLEAEAVHVKKNGNERRAKSKNADMLKVCFKVDENPVAEAGGQDYLIRIVSPEGVTLYEEQRGSGTMASLENGLEGSELKYTAPATIEYNNEVKSVCWYWQQDNAYEKGEYTAEVYHRGYMVGSDKFVM